MGESIVEPPMVEDKMRGAPDNPCTPLDVSVSFGRFESDSLSWEKWSTFSPNKYLEEVEKCATPGSVAQKKAYFEAHYKKIAARKIVEMEQEKQNDADENGEDHVEKICEYDDQDKHVDSFEVRNKFDESKEKSQNGEDHVAMPCEYDGQAKHLDGFLNSSHFDESNENSTITVDSQCSIIDEVVDSRSTVIDGTKEEVLCEPNSPELRKGAESVPVQKENQEVGLQGEMEPPSAIVEEKMESQRNLEKKPGKNQITGKGKMDMGALKKSPKLAHLDKPKTPTATKKKPTQSLPKLFPKISTSKVSKPIPVSTASTPSRVSAMATPSRVPTAATPSRFSTVVTPSRSTAKKTNSSSLQRSKIVEESKKIPPASLHMSLSLDPANDDSPSRPINRKSLIMEKMGNKDIVKRAFKSFQNSFKQERASEDPTLSVPNKVTTSRDDSKVSSTLTSQKEYNGLRRGGKMDVQRTQLGKSLNSTVNGLGSIPLSQDSAWNSLGCVDAGIFLPRYSPLFPFRPLKGVSMDQRRAKPAPSSFGVRNDEKRKDISKKPVEELSAKESERAGIASNSKEKKAKTKNLRQSLSFKATPMPSFYRGTGASENSATKEGEHHRRLEMHR